jgi:putative aldouronate transport system substrate-binding protein
MRKAVYLCLALVLMAGLVYAAYRIGGKNLKQEPSDSGAGLESAAGEPVTLRILFPLEKPLDHDQVIRAVEEKLANDGLPLKLDFTFIPFDQYWSKVWLNAASGEAYDLALVSYSNISDMVSKKVLAPLDGALADYGKDLLASTPDYAFQGVTINGQIYGIPRVMPIAEHQSFVQIRGDLRKKYNLPPIRSIADMDRYLETIAKNEPGIVPYFYDTGPFLLREYGDVAFLAGNYLNAPVYIDPADPELKVRATYESDFFKKIMEKMHEWQRKGYIPYGPSGTPVFPDPEKALYEGKIAATWSVVLKQTERIDSFKEKLPLAELENVFLHPEKPKYMFTAADNILSVFSTSKHVNETVAFMNWVRQSQENYDLFTYGVKDVNYKLVGDAISYDEVAPEKRYMSIQWAWNDIRFARFSKHLSVDYKNELRNWDKDAVASPTLGFVIDLSPIKSEVAQVNVIISEYLPLLYEESVDWDSTMAQFKAKLKDAGIEHVKMEIQKQFDAFQARSKSN